LGHYVAGVELLNGSRGPPDYRLQSNSEYRDDYPRRKTTGDNVRGQKGNNPDRQLRSRITSECIRKLGFEDSGDVGLEAATI